MPRSLDRLRPLAAVSIVALLLGHVGCHGSKPEVPATSGPSVTPASGSTQAAGAAAATESESESESKASTSAPPGPRPLFDGWPNPDGVLVIGGEQLGYLEPCGCTAGQSGGLHRRYELTNKLRDERKWPVVSIDLGSLMKDPMAARGGPEQSKLKFTIALKALAALGDKALALSPEDLELGVDEVVGQLLNLPDGQLEVVAANVQAPGLETKLVPSVRASAGPLKVGITAVVDPEMLKTLRDPSVDLLQVRPIDEALAPVLADLEATTDAQVLLVQAPPATAKALAGKYPGFDVVVGTSTYADPPEDAERLNDGKTLLLTVGHKGKYVGVVGLYRDGGTSAHRYQRVLLDERFDGPAAAMKAIIQGEFREGLKQQRVVENFPKHAYPARTADAAGAAFVGVDACKKCHPATVEAWRESKHSHAFASLEHDPKPNTIYDVECISCHTVGFEYTSGYVSAEKTPGLKDVQCENCHGPASKHVAEPTSRPFLAALRVTRAQADRNRLCLGCHDEDNSPKFDFDKYWDEVEHNGLDDPKEHLDPADRAQSKAGPTVK